MDPTIDVVDLGSFCDTLIADPHFQFISAHFEQGLVAEMLATQPHETKKREFVYTKIQAHREFLTHLVELIKMKNEAITPKEIEQPLLDPNGFDYQEA